uniref:Uncharacterized protein n=1 Tax=Heliothis virescens TaxID=7102 RepID=A0A2A4JAM5_HELVI
MKVGADFLRTLNQQADFVQRMNEPFNFKSKGKLPKKVFGSEVIRAFTGNQENQKFRSDDKKPTNGSPTSQIHECMRHLQKKGNETLHDIGKQIITNLNISMNIDSMLKASSGDYFTTMQNYNKVASKQRYNTTLDREFVYLDMVETSNSLLYSIERKLLNDIISNQTNVSDTSIKTLNEKIYKHSVLKKKDNIKYICRKFDVCRHYPAFTDYCADLISEILKLTDKKFTAVIEISKRILKENKDFFEKVTENEDRDLIIKKLQYFSTDLFAMKEFFAVLRTVITQRFKAVSTADNTLKKRTLATRILLDIVDKSLSGDEDLLAIDFDNSVSALRSWAGGVRRDIDGIYEDFAKNLFRIMGFNLTKGARKEMKILIQIIMREIEEDDKFVQNLFINGSKYVKGEDFHPLIDTLDA